MHKLTISVKQEKRKVAKFLHEFFFFILLKNFVREARAKLVDKKNTSVDDEIPNTLASHILTTIGKRP